MPDTPDRLSRRWLHSFEEDHEGVQVYRPSGHPFPPARGRDGIEFRPDGTFIDLPIGRGDANEARPGRWHGEPQGPVHVHTEAAGRRVMDVVRLEPDRLEVRWREEAG
ncbi:hypothetical protein MCAG_00610 [Micromonospora sp. ATCC 39149]|uniref:Uncharacterized protein n=1 Tax=Micromonospora carbonacea TaxID=47853 RepID=A0A7D5Y6K9_9ACTN|nr:hypothetical protein [Micromonospora sp. ATCC 39149]EEP70283.1 hypothetical protein MCAG_00610 [Micromonospora sp. ATCC 39149]QLJ96701.1 hypothetical protein HZU44_17460 [Micromonospora carbonacea]